VEEEIATQIKACLDRGLYPTHLDSHHHVRHGVGHRRLCYHYRAPLWDTGYPTITQLWTSDRSCPQVLQICK
jgi:hypothetical protein